MAQIKDPRQIIISEKTLERVCAIVAKTLDTGQLPLFSNTCVATIPNGQRTHAVCFLDWCVIQRGLEHAFGITIPKKDFPIIGYNFCQGDGFIDRSRRLTEKGCKWLESSALKSGHIPSNGLSCDFSADRWQNGVTIRNLAEMVVLVAGIQGVTISD